MNEVLCPRCQSNQITGQKHGVSAGKAVAGAVIAGPLGLLAGLHGSSNIDVTCLGCGHTWNPKSEYEKKQQHQNQSQIANNILWVSEVIKLYDAGDLAGAETAYKSNPTHKPFTTIEAAYKDVKSRQANSNILVLVWLFIFAILAYVLIKIIF